MIRTVIFVFLPFFVQANSLTTTGTQAVEFMSVLQTGFNIECLKPQGVVDACDVKINSMICQKWSEGYELMDCSAEYPKGNSWIVVFAEKQKAEAIHNFLLRLGLVEDEFESGGIVHKSITVDSIQCKKSLSNLANSSCKIAWH